VYKQEEKLLMNIIRTASILILTAIFISGSAQAEGQKLADKLSKGVMTLSVQIKGCDADAKKYCPGLPSNSQKAFMCMMAYEDKLSTTCKLGIAEAAMSMKMGMIAIDYSIRACEADADKHCLKVQPGEGRLVSCLKKNEAKVSKDCVSALKQTGLWNIATK
jgi:hypothetical protein